MKLLTNATVTELFGTLTARLAMDGAPDDVIQKVVDAVEKWAEWERKK